MSEMEGETEKANEFKSQLEDLEERAVELDKRRTSNISGIRYVIRAIAWLMY
jgi:RNA polymerase-associated protein RTF1